MIWKVSVGLLVFLSGLYLTMYLDISFSLAFLVTAIPGLLGGIITSYISGNKYRASDFLIGLYGIIIFALIMTVKFLVKPSSDLGAAGTFVWSLIFYGGQNIVSGAIGGFLGKLVRRLVYKGDLS